MNLTDEGEDALLLWRMEGVLRRRGVECVMEG